MQTVDLSSFMESAVIEVLEEMCFISWEGLATDGAEQSQPDWVCGELDFFGESSGTFGIAVPATTASTIAANFLGEEEAALTDRETSEVICELTNMVCGTLLSQFDSKHSFVLSPPRSGPHGVIGEAACNRVQKTYAIDEGCIQAWVELRASA